MKHKIIVLMLSLATCLAVESGLHAAEEKAQTINAIELEEFAERAPYAIIDILESLPTETLAKLVQTSKKLHDIAQPILDTRNLIKYWTDKSVTPDLLSGHISPVRSLVFSPNGKILASGHEDNIIILWNVQTNKEIGRLPGHTAAITSLAFSSDGNTLASGSKDKTVRLWDIKTQTSKEPLKHNGEVLSVAFSPDGNTVAAGANTSLITLWDVQSGTAKLHYDAYWPKVIAFSSDGNIVVSSDGNKSISLLTIATGEFEEKELNPDANVYHLALSPDAKLLAIPASTFIELWSVGTGNKIKKLPNDEFTLSLSFSPDCNLLVAGLSQGTIKLWKVKTGKEIKLFPATGNVFSVAFSRDGKKLAAGLADGTIKLWK